jgi:uncharacterized protein with GYD domain
MPYYMIQFTFTPEAWAALSRNPENRSEPVRALVEGLGGRVIAHFYCFGEYDGLVITEMPDNISAAAGSIISNKAGHLKAVKTTLLLTVEEGMEVMRKAGSMSFQRPTG